MVRASLNLSARVTKRSICFCVKHGTDVVSPAVVQRNCRADYKKCSAIS